MGHASLGNLRKVFTRRIFAKGRVSVAECIKIAQNTGETVHASEGDYEDEGTVGAMFGEVVGYYHRLKVVEPVSLTEKQKPVYDEFAGVDGVIYEWEIFDTISWKFAKGWRKKYSEIEVLDCFTN